LEVCENPSSSALHCSNHFGAISGVDSVSFFSCLDIFYQFQLEFVATSQPCRLDSLSIRGIFIWGILLGMLIWNLPLLFQQTFAEGFDYGVILVFFISLPMGLVISIVLGYYSVIFVKHTG
jgi:hypothetical protein